MIYAVFDKRCCAQAEQVTKLILLIKCTFQQRACFISCTRSRFSILIFSVPLRMENDYSSMKYKLLEEQYKVLKSRNEDLESRILDIIEKVGYSIVILEKLYV